MKENLAQKCDNLQKELEQLKAQNASLRSIVYNESVKDILTYSPVIQFTASLKSYSQYLDTRHYFFTLSHDTVFLQFPTIISAINYYTKIITDTIKELNIECQWDINGCFETNKNGNVHCHFIFSTYDSTLIIQLHDLLTPKLTHRPELDKAVKIVPVNDSVQNQTTGNYGVHGTCDYMEKDYLKLFRKKTSSFSFSNT